MSCKNGRLSSHSRQMRGVRLTNATVTPRGVSSCQGFHRMDLTAISAAFVTARTGSVCLSAICHTTQYILIDNASLLRIITLYTASRKRKPATFIVMIILANVDQNLTDKFRNGLHRKDRFILSPLLKSVAALYPNNSVKELNLHCFIPGSKLTFSTNLFHHSLLAPTWTAFSDYTGPDLLCSTVFHF